MLNGLRGRKQWSLSVAALVIALMLAACGSQNRAPSSTDSANTTEQNIQQTIQESAGQSGVEPKGKIYVSYPSIPDLGDVASLLAWEEMGRMGYEVIPKFMAESELAVEAVMRDDAQLGITSSPIFAAIDKGAPLVNVVSTLRNEWTLIGRGDVKTLQDLEGKRLGQHSPAAIGKAMTDAVLEANAPDVNPNVIYIAGSENRADALLRDQLDASPVEIVDLVRLMNEAPGKFNIVSSYAQDLSGLIGLTMFVKNDYMEKNPQVVKDAIKALLTVYQRAKEEPDFIVENAPKYLPSLEENILKEAAELYHEYDLWPADGDMDEETQKYTVDFWTEQGLLENNLSYEAYFDRTLLDEVLQEMGQ